MRHQTTGQPYFPWQPRSAEILRGELLLAMRDIIDATEYSGAIDLLCNPAHVLDTETGLRVFIGRLRLQDKAIIICLMAGASEEHAPLYKNLQDCATSEQRMQLVKSLVDEFIEEVFPGDCSLVVQDSDWEEARNAWLYILQDIYDEDMNLRTLSPLPHDKNAEFKQIDAGTRVPLQYFEGHPLVVCPGCGGNVIADCMTVKNIKAAEVACLHCQQIFIVEKT